MSNVQKRRISFRFIVFLAVLCFVATGILLSPIFKIKQVDVYGNFVLTTAEIKEAAQIEAGMNIFSFGSYSALRRVVALPYAHTVSIERQLPDRIIIRVIERQAVANVATGEGIPTYLLIDGEGMVLKTGQAAVPHLPKVTGLGFSGFSVGQFLVLDNEGAARIFEDILYLTDIFAVYDFSPDIVDFGSPRDIVIYYENFDIAFGSMEDAQQKVRYLKGIMETPPHGMDRGFIDIRDVNSPRFRLSR